MSRWAISEAFGLSLCFPYICLYGYIFYWNYSWFIHILSKYSILNPVSRLESVDWRVDYVLSSSELKEVNEPSVQLRLHVKNPDTGDVEATSLTLSADKFRVFLSGK